MNSDNPLFPVVCLRREPCLLIRKKPIGDILERLIAWRVVAEYLRLLDAQQLGRADLLSLRDVLRVSLALTPAALRVGPAYPPSGLSLR